jgi:hypothetical protein
MTTKNIVPRADGEGGIGTVLKRWGEGHFDSVEVTGDLVVESKNISTMLSYLTGSIIGVKWDTASSSPDLTRIDRNGGTLTTSTTTFDLHPIWGGMRRCNMSDAGVVTAYYGDTAFAVDGSNGQVMVEIPKFWYRVIDVGTDRYFWISATPAPGFKVHPMFISNSVESNYAYVGAFEASVYDVTASATEVNTITVTAGASASGNLTVTLDGNYAFTVAVTAAQDAATVAGAIRAAGNKTDYQGVIWTVGGSDATVTYTAGSTGLKTTVTVGAAETGVTATIVKSTPGAGGYVKNDAAGYALTATTGDKLASIAGVKPATGWKNSTLYLPAFRTLAQNRGAGWGLMSFHQICGVQLLYLIEYATFDSQTALSVGVTNITDDVGTNMAVNTGVTAGVGTGASNLANASGEVSITHYKTAQTTTPFSYRGIENLYGNAWQWVDGINIKADRNPWIADHDFASDTFAHPYADTGLTLPATTGYPTALVNVPAIDYSFLPSAVGGTGSQTKYTCDYYYQAVDNRAAGIGGSWSSGASSGAFCLLLIYTASKADRSIGARLARSG